MQMTVEESGSKRAVTSRGPEPTFGTGAGPLASRAYGRLGPRYPKAAVGFGLLLFYVIFLGGVAVVPTYFPVSLGQFAVIAGFVIAQSWSTTCSSHARSLAGCGLSSPGSRRVARASRHWTHGKHRCPCRWNICAYLCATSPRFGALSPSAFWRQSCST